MISRIFPKIVLLASCLSLASLAGCMMTPDNEASCPDIGDSGQLNVLTINLLFSEIETRDERLASIAQFIADNRVDFVMLQEVVGGQLVRTENSALDLQDALADDHGLTFDSRTAFETGIPGLLTVANAVLSRCDILDQRVQRLPKTSELEIGGQTFPLFRNVTMTRLDLPDVGNVSVYNTHLCARCTVAERAEQLNVLLDFVDESEAMTPSGVASVLGGDLNIDIFRDGGEARPLYDGIIGAGFTDTAADGRTLEELCENRRAADEHCTVGVSDLNGPNARRIDYIFARGFGEVLANRVAFNPLIDSEQPTVSDHAGVFSSIALPAIAVAGN
ncbi:MAG: endonuclease/exonuclease/phosphatase family protein [Alphaproteobacteria bacterium]|nr:endonuclease/exonuclease/phosphatase family protein [Alphaproteobacteria bacterium]